MNKVFKFSLVLLIFSCNTNNYIPGEVIKPQQMQHILWDMIRGDILAREIVKTDSTLNFEHEDFAIIEKIFILNHTSRQKFEKSIIFYERHPVLMRAIFDSLHAVQFRQNSPEVIRKREPVKEKNFPEVKY